MAYATYTTKALVCGSTDSYTSDRSYLLFTKDAGMLWATARSVREERSKQRAALQDFSFIRVSLVKGKTGWRVGSVEAEGNPFLAAADRKTRGLVNFIVQQLRRYIHGEGGIGPVYEDVEVLLTQHDLDFSTNIKQSVFLLRLLSQLGYIAPHSTFAPIVSANTISLAMQAYTEDMKNAVEMVIEKATKTSHL